MGFGLVILKDFRIGLFCLAALSFTQLASLEFLEDYHVFLLCFFLTVSAFIIFSLRNLAFQYNTSWIFKWLILFLTIVFCSGLYAENGDFWQKETYAFARAFILFFLIIQGVDSERSLFTMGRMIVLALFVSSFVPFLNLLSSNQNMLSVVLLRFIGTLSDPNDYAMTLCGALPLAVFYAKSEDKKALKVLYAICSLAFIFFIVVTQSRGGIVAVIISLFLLLPLIRRKWVIIVASLICVTIILSQVPAQFFFHRIIQLFNSLTGKSLYDASFSQRYLLSKSAFTMFLNYPIFGVGANNFIVHSVRFISPSLYAHNMFAEIAVDLGLLGFIPFVVIIFSPFFWFPRVIKAAEIQGRPVQASFIRFIRISLIGMIITSLFLSCQSKVYLWVVVAMVYATRNVLDRTSEMTDNICIQNQ